MIIIKPKYLFRFRNRNIVAGEEDPFMFDASHNRTSPGSNGGRQWDQLLKNPASKLDLSKEAIRTLETLGHIFTRLDQLSKIIPSGSGPKQQLQREQYSVETTSDIASILADSVAESTPIRQDINLLANKIIPELTSCINRSLPDCRLVFVGMQVSQDNSIAYPEFLFSHTFNKRQCEVSKFKLDKRIIPKASLKVLDSELLVGGYPNSKFNSHPLIASHYFDVGRAELILFHNCATAIMGQIAWNRIGPEAGAVLMETILKLSLAIRQSAQSCKGSRNAAELSFFRQLQAPKGSTRSEQQVIAARSTLLLTTALSCMLHFFAQDHQPRLIQIPHNNAQDFLRWIDNWVEDLGLLTLQELKGKR